MKKAVVMFLLLSLLVMSNAVYAVDILPGGLPAFPGAEAEVCIQQELVPFRFLKFTMLKI